MKKNISLAVRLLLVIAAVISVIYTYSLGNKPTYISSIVAVLGTVALLIQHIKKNYKG